MVARAPALLAGVYLLTLLAALPFGLVVGRSLQQALVEQNLSRGESEEFDVEWWQRFRLHARGLEATFTPSVIGVVAVLDNASAVLDGDRRPLVLLLPVALYGAAWMFLWGGVFERFWSGHRGLRAFLGAAAAHVLRFAVIGLISAGATFVLYLTLHAWLFGPVYERLVAAATSVQVALAWRIALYVAFGMALVSIGILVDYTRLFSVARRGQRLTDTVSMAVAFIRSHFSAVAWTYLLTGSLLVIAIAGYWTIEVVGRTQVGGWRAVLLAQIYVALRLAIRLTFGASAVALVKEFSQSDRWLSGNQDADPRAAAT